MCFFVIKIQVISFEVWSLKKAKKKKYIWLKCNYENQYLLSIFIFTSFKHMFNTLIPTLNDSKYQWIETLQIRERTCGINFHYFLQNNDFDAKANQYVLNCVY